MRRHAYLVSVMQGTLPAAWQDMRALKFLNLSTCLLLNGKLLARLPRLLTDLSANQLCKQALCQPGMRVLGCPR